MKYRSSALTINYKFLVVETTYLIYFLRYKPIWYLSTQFMEIHLRIFELLSSIETNKLNQMYVDIIGVYTCTCADPEDGG